MKRNFSPAIVFMLLLVWCAGASHAAIPAYAQKIERIYLGLVPTSHEVNSPMKIYYVRKGDPNIKIAAPICEGLVTVTCTGGPNNSSVMVYSASQLKWKHGEEGAVTITLPSKPGLYQYRATLTITDPDDPTNVWCKKSNIQWISVYTILERTTVTIGPEEGTVTSPKFPDSPRITFPKGALSGKAQVTLEVYSDHLNPVIPQFNSDDVMLGRMVRVYVEGARLQITGYFEAFMPYPAEPAYPYYVMFNSWNGEVIPVPDRIREYRNGGFTCRFVWDPQEASNTKKWGFWLDVKLTDMRRILKIPKTVETPEKKPQDTNKAPGTEQQQEKKAE